MICYVDIEHENALRDVEKRAVRLAHCEGVKRRLEETSGHVCLVRRYERVTRGWLRGQGIRALLIGGNTTEWAEYGEADLLELSSIIRGAELPIIGFCGGCHLIAMAHGARLGPVRRLGTGEEDPCQDYAPGYFKEWGFLPVNILKSDSIFDGLGKQPRFLEAHYWEIKGIPPGFELLGSTDSCRIQVIRQVGRPVYGTQFRPKAYVEGQGGHYSWLIDLVYPEGYNEEQPDGRRLLTNFFRLAGILE